MFNSRPQFYSTFNSRQQFYSRQQFGFNSRPQFGFNFNFSRASSTGEGGKRANNILGNILNTLYTNYVNKEYISNEQSQLAIEKLVFDQYELLFKNYKGYSVSGINTDLLTSKLKSYIIDNKEGLVSKIQDFKEFYLNPCKKKKTGFWNSWYY